MIDLGEKVYRITMQIFGYNRNERYKQNKSYYDKDCIEFGSYNTVDYIDLYIPLTSLGYYYDKPDLLYNDYVLNRDDELDYKDFIKKRIWSPRGEEIFIERVEGDKDYTLATILNYEEVIYE